MGFGKKLLLKAEEMTYNLGLRSVAVIAGVGVRNYYRKLGYLDREGAGNFQIKVLVDENVELNVHGVSVREKRREVIPCVTIPPPQACAIKLQEVVLPGAYEEMLAREKDARLRAKPVRAVYDPNAPDSNKKKEKNFEEADPISDMFGLDVDFDAFPTEEAKVEERVAKVEEEAKVEEGVAKVVEEAKVEEGVTNFDVDNDTTSEGKTEGAATGSANVSSNSSPPVATGANEVGEMPQAPNANAVKESKLGTTNSPPKNNDAKAGGHAKVERTTKSTATKSASQNLVNNNVALVRGQPIPHFFETVIALALVALLLFV
jgi:hypothetical protein